MEKITCTHCGTSNPDNLRYCTNCGYELPKVKIETPAVTVEQPLEKSKKLSVSQLVGIVVGVGTMFAVQHLFFKTPTYDKAMVEVASEINKTCPLMIDKETRLDNVLSLPGNIFEYNYTLISTGKAFVDTIALKSLMEPKIVNFVKTNPAMKIQRENKTTVNYYYKDKDGNYLFTVSITPDKYDNGTKL